MSEENRDREFAREIGKHERRRRKATRRRDGGWFGLGMYGLVGWSFAIPVLAFLALGLWIDGVLESVYSWTLMLLAIGVVAGGANVWFWIRHEQERSEEEEEADE